MKSCFWSWDFQFYLSAIGQPGFVNPEFEGGCATADVVAGIRAAADAGAKVINLSLGGAGQSPAQNEAVNYAVQRGAFVAMAVGNEFEDGNPVEYPATYRTADSGRHLGRRGRPRRPPRLLFQYRRASGDRRARRRFAGEAGRAA